MEELNIYPKTKPLRDALKENRDTADSLRMLEEDTAAGRKVEEEEFWSIHDEPLNDFGLTFLDCIPQEYVEADRDTAFQRYIEATLAGDNPNQRRTGVEFGGPGRNLFSGFSQGFFTQTAGVALTNINKIGTPDTETHHVIEGNITDIGNRKLYEDLTQALGASKVDLVISRMAGGITHIEKHPAILDKIIRKWYSLLNKNGLMFIQFGYFDYTSKEYKLVRNWAEALKAKFPEIEIDISKDTEIMRIHKKENAPDEIPTAGELLK